MTIYIVIKENDIQAYRNMKQVCEATDIVYGTISKHDWDKGAFAYNGCLVLKRSV